jgi:hypothetical protein
MNIDKTPKEKNLVLLTDTYGKPLCVMIVEKVTMQQSGTLVSGKTWYLQHHERPGEVEVMIYDTKSGDKIIDRRGSENKAVMQVAALRLLGADEVEDDV